MSADIVERLRRWNRDGIPTAIPPQMMMREAADEIERLRQLQAHIQDMTGWRPIESAPRDDTRILVWRPRASEFCPNVGVDRWRMINCKKPYEGWAMSSTVSQPTHWMPLPPPPQEGGDK